MGIVSACLPVMGPLIREHLVALSRSIVGWRSTKGTSSTYTGGSRSGPTEKDEQAMGRLGNVDTIWARDGGSVDDGMDKSLRPDRNASEVETDVA